MSRDAIQRNLAALRAEVTYLDRRRRWERMGAEAAVGEIDLIEQDFGAPIEPGADAIRDYEQTAAVHRGRV